MLAGANRPGIKSPPATDFQSHPGLGASANIHGEIIAIGGARMIENGKSVTPELEKTAGIWATEGRTVLYVLRNNDIIGALAIEDEIRPEAAAAINALHKLGIRVAMITGDSHAVAYSVAKRLGIDDVEAQVLPADKASAVTRFQSGGKKVAMVGDGVNDAPPSPAPMLASPSETAPMSQSSPPESFSSVARRRPCHRTLPRHLPQDGAKPRLGNRLQPGRHPRRRRSPHSMGF
uniref:HAD-IC family P-type ATPase n=1 Tax=Edaphobacter bradus TaxID=2259016 RepID=UPI0037C0685A